MHKTTALILAATFLLATLIVEPASGGIGAENSWTKKNSMHKPRSELGVAAVNGKIYAIGGTTEEGHIPFGKDYNANEWILNTNEEYNTLSNKWAYKAPMPTARYRFACAACQDKIYCIGGTTDNVKPTYTSVNEVYDPETNSWETKSPAPEENLGQANVVNDKIYFIGGGTNNNLTIVYDPNSDTWTTAAPSPEVVSFMVSAVIDNKIYVLSFGGRGLANTVCNKQLVYDTTNDTWGTEPFETNKIKPEGLAGHDLWEGGLWYSSGGAATSGVYAPKRIYVFLMGYCFMGPLPNVGYDFENGTWSFCADMPTNRQGFGVATVNDIIYVVGGYFSNYPFPDDTFFFVNQTGANECYTPLGYGSVHYTPSPSPTPTPTEAPSPTPTATATPTAIQTQTTTIVAIAAVVIAAVVMSTAVYLRKHNT